MGKLRPQEGKKHVKATKLCSYPQRSGFLREEQRCSSSARRGWGQTTPSQER